MIMRSNVLAMTFIRPALSWDALFPRWLALLLLAWGSVTSAAAQPFPPDQPVLEVFVREGCPHCADAKSFLVGFTAERPWLRVVYRSLDDDPTARDDLARHSRNAGVWPPGVPTFVMNGGVLVGFQDAATTGPELVRLVTYRPLTESAAKREREDDSERRATSVETQWLGTLSAERFGLPLFTLAMGLLDGFNPCAMWVLLFLLSMLVHLQDRKRMAMVAGTFVIASGVVYYAFMAAWLNVFLLVGFTTPVRLTLAIVALAIGAINIKDFIAFGHGVSLSIPNSAKPGLYARMRALLRTESVLPSLVGVAALAVVVNFIEILCTAGLPAIYTAVLVQQDLSSTAHYGYLGLYILGYMADDSLMVATAVIALSSRKLTERAGRWLKLISGAVMIALAIVMLLRPEWLT
jgi:hypothetical protein